MGPVSFIAMEDKSSHDGLAVDSSVGEERIDAGRAVGVKQERRREKLLQRVWPKMMIGAMFVLEVVWIGFLAYVSIVFISLHS
jgi:hypothetical protein